MVENELVEVIWIDACLEEGHLPLDTAKELLPLERTEGGYIIADKPEYIILTFGFIENFYKGARACNMAFAIPKSMIKSMRKAHD